MAQLPILEVADRWFAALESSVNASTTSWVLSSSGATNLPSRTIVHCDSEKVLVTGIATDTPSAGLDTLTVVRGYGGTTAASHSAGAQVAHLNYKEFHNSTMARLAAMEYFIYTQWGKTDGRLQAGLSVQAQGTPSMTIDVTAGGAIVIGHPTALREDITITFVAPVGNPRIDTVQIDQDGVVSVKTGTPAGSPSAPAADADALKLAEVYITTAATSIKDTDDSTNGYITQTDNWL